MGRMLINSIGRVANGKSTTWQTGVVVSALVLWSLLMFLLCWRSGPYHHDYLSYVRNQWQLLLDGGDPWSTKKNTYGPAYTVIGYLLPWGILAPKFFMVGVMLLANAALVLKLMRQRGMSPIQAIYLLAIPTNVLLIGAGVVYGLNDTIVAALLVFAVLLRHRGDLLAAGGFVGLAALTKFYPLLLLPFFAIEGSRLRWSVIAIGTAVFFVGLAAAMAVWGHGPVDAILKGSIRSPKLLSILAALKSAFGHNEVVDWLLRNNIYFVVSGVAAVFLFAWRARLNWLEGAVLGYLVMLTLYKVGHQQFYIPWLFMVGSLPLVNKRSADRIAIILLPAVLMLSLYHFGYEFASDQYHHVLGWVRLYGGFIAFPVSAASIAACVFDLWKHRCVSSRQDRQKA